jgi:hypothetical protein
MMAKTLGPTFTTELHAAMGNVDGVIWFGTDDSVQGLDSLTPDRRALFLSVVAAHDPTKQPVVPLNFLQFMALFTQAEQAAIVTSADVQVKLFVLMASGALSIDLTNQQVAGGVNYLASANLITSARASQILAGTAPGA